MAAKSLHRAQPRDAAAHHQHPRAAARGLHAAAAWLHRAGRDGRRASPQLGGEERTEEAGGGPGAGRGRGRRSERLGEEARGEGREVERGMRGGAGLRVSPSRLRAPPWVRLGASPGGAAQGPGWWRSSAGSADAPGRARASGEGSVCVPLCQAVWASVPTEGESGRPARRVVFPSKGGVGTATRKRRRRLPPASHKRASAFTLGPHGAHGWKSEERSGGCCGVGVGRGRA